MYRHFNLFLWLVCVAFVWRCPAGAAPATGGGKEPEEDKPVRIDLHGDPLPTGAIARLGIGRLRHAGEPCCLVFSPNGKVLASGAREDRLIHLWDAETGKDLRQLAGHEDGVACLKFSPDGKYLASGSWDKTIRVWDAATGKLSSPIINHPGTVHAIAFSPDGKSLASGGRESENIYLWQTTTGKEVRRWQAHRGGISSLAFAPDGKALASGGQPTADGKNDSPTDAYAAAIWDPARGKMLSQCSGQTVFVGALAFSPDGKTLASAGIEKPHFRSLALWETATGKVVRLIKDPRINDPTCVAFAPDGKTVAAGQIGSVHFWDLPNAKLLWSLDNVHWDDFHTLGFSPDGKTLASAARTGQIRLWDVARRKERFDFPGHRYHITAFAVAPDSKTAVTGSIDGTARLWELATGKEVRQFRDVSEGARRHVGLECRPFAGRKNRGLVASRRCGGDSLGRDPGPDARSSDGAQ